MSVFVPVTVPAGLESGRHTLLATGVDPQGVERTLTLPVTVPPASASTSGAGSVNQSTILPVPAGGGIVLLDSAGRPTSAVSIAGQGTYLLDAATGTITFVAVRGFVGTATAEGVDFSGAYPADADLSGANPEGATFDEAFMVGVSLHGADPTAAGKGAKPTVLTSAHLQGVDFSGVRPGAADLAGAVVTNARGNVDVQYYDENGVLQSEPQRYLGSPFPDAREQPVRRGRR
jgi:hypothetical protein